MGECRIRQLWNIHLIWISSHPASRLFGHYGHASVAAVCHPDGGNIVNPQKTLHKKDREANGVKTTSDIVNKMRNPGPGMTQFDGKTISDKDAAAIAGYILKTF